MLNRLGMLLRSALRAFPAPAEDPREAAPEPLDRLEALLTQIRGALAATESTRRNLEAKGAQLEARRSVMEEQARRALRAGRQDLAHLTLERCRAAERERGALDPHIEAVRQEERRLGLMEQQLVARIESLDTRHAMVAARYNAAQAQVHLSEALAGISADLAGLRAVLDQTERETEQMESRAAAIDRLADSGAFVADVAPGGDALDGKPADL